MAVLERTAAGSAREPDPAAVRQPLERRPYLRLLVDDDGITVRHLVAREPERVERERVDIRRRALLLDQAAQNPDLDGVGVHAATG